MRTGGVDQARMSRRKRSPKPKPKKIKPNLTPHGPPHGSSQTVPSDTCDSSTLQRQCSDAQLEGGRDGQREAEIEQAMDEDLEKSTEVSQ